MRKVRGPPTDTIALGGAYMMGRLVNELCEFIFFSLNILARRRLND